MGAMDPRLRAAVDASACWYDNICASHGVAASIVEGIWISRTAPPPLHSAANVIEPWVGVHQVLRAVERFEHCSVADCFASLDLGPVGMEVLFTAEWIHRAAHPSERPPGLEAGRWCGGTR